METSAAGIDRAVDFVAAEIRRRLVEREAPLIVAIDGRSGAGKSTLAERVAEHVGAVVIPGDDFYAGGTDAEWAERTPKQRVAACIDWRRIRTEALEPLRAGRAAQWRPFDFAAGAGLAPSVERRNPAPVVILDGAYAARPELADLLDLTVLVEAADDQERRRRLVAREGQPFMDAWHALWDAAEEHYFTRVRPRFSFDLVVTL